MMLVRNTLLILTVLTALTSQFAQAAVNATVISRSIDLFMTEHIQSLTQRFDDSVSIDYKIGALDSRISMPDCSAPLTVELKTSIDVGRTNVRVSCQHNSPWSIYVPLTVNLYRPVVTTKGPVSRGINLVEKHLKLSKMNISFLNGSYYTNLNEVIGMQAKRPLRADSIVLASSLTLPVLVKRGDSVVLSARSGSLVVKITAIALKDGHEGEQIAVRNKQSKRIVDARVTGRGMVSVAM